MSVVVLSDNDCIYTIDSDIPELCRKGIKNKSTASERMGAANGRPELGGFHI